MPKTNRLIEGLNSSAYKFQQEESERMNAQFETDAGVSPEGVVRWKSNNNVPPSDVLEFWKHLGKSFNYELSVQVSEEEDRTFLQEYRKRKENHQYSEEERFEMRNAFGAGATVVDVITGKRTIL